MAEAHSNAGVNVAVLIPVLRRPHRVAPLVESLRASYGLARVRPVFTCSPDDVAEAAAVINAGLVPLIVQWPAGRGDYAKKINHAARNTDEEWLFLAADDLVFHPGWLDAALTVHEKTGACVIGTNDHGNARVRAGRHSTHSLVHRDYLECGTIDEPGKLLHEGYDHNFVDDEFVQTAMFRRTFAPARLSVVEHLHPCWGKAVPDATYAKGQRKFAADRHLFNKRAHLWRAQRFRPRRFA